MKTFKDLECGAGVCKIHLWEFVIVCKNLSFFPPLPPHLLSVNFVGGKIYEY